MPRVHARWRIDHDNASFTLHRGMLPVLLSQTPYVCFEVQTGKHLLGLNLTAFDPIQTLLGAAALAPLVS